MKKGRLKRFIMSLFLTLCMVVNGICPVAPFTMTAYAQTTTENGINTITSNGTADETATMTITLVILKTPAATDLTYTAPSDLTYSGSDKTATVEAASGVTGLGTITVKYYSDASRTTEATPKNVGTYYVGATVAEGDQYAASTAVLYGDGWTFEITASTPDAPAAPTKASTTKNSITLNTVDGCEYSKDGVNWQSGTEFTGLNPGTEYTFYQRVKATANTNASAASSASFSTEADTYAMTITLTIKEMEVSAENVSVAYDGQPHGITVNVTDPNSGYTVKYGTVEGTYDLDASPTQTEVGTQTVYYQVTANNYVTKTGSATVTISKASAVAATVTANHRTYDGTDKPLVNVTGEAKGGEMQYALGENATTAPANNLYTTSIPSGTDAGIYYVWYKAVGNVNYDDSEPVCVVVSVKKLTVTVSGIKAKDKAYDATAAAETDTSEAVIAGIINDDSLTVTAAGLFSDANAGTAKTVSLSSLKLEGDSAANYELDTENSQKTATASITKKAATISAEAQSVSLNSPIDTGLKMASVTGLVNGEILTAITLTGSSTAAVTSTGTITPSAAKIMRGETDVTANYQITYEEGVLTVTVIPAVIKTAPVAVKDLVYNGEAQTLLSAGSAEGGTIVYALGDDAENAPAAGYSETIPAVTVAGTCYVWYKAAGDANHTDTAAYCVINTIAKRKVTVTAKDQTVSFNKAVNVSVNAAELTGAAEGHILKTVSVNSSGSAAVTDAGTITVSSAKIFSGNTDVTVNYEISYVSGRLIVTRVDAVVKKAPAASENLVYNGVVQKLLNAGEAEGGSFKYSIGSSATEAPDAESFTSKFPTAKEAGTYYVWYKVAADNDHNDTAAACITVSIAKSAAVSANSLGAEQKAAAKTGDDVIYTGRAIKLISAPAAVPEGYKMSYSIDGGQTWSEEIPTAVEAGNYTVKVKYVADDNHVGFDGEDIAVTIAPKDVSTIVTIRQAEGQSISYNGTAQRPEVTVSVYEAILTEGTDYTVSFEGVEPTVYSVSANAPVYAGTYRMIISYKGNYTGTSEINFTIDKQVPPEAEGMPGEQKPISVSGNAAVYTGGEVSLVTPPASLPDGYTGVMYSIDGGVTWTSEIPTVVEAGTYTVKVKYVADADHEDFIADDIVITIDPAHYMISFNANGGRGTMADQEVILSKPSDKAALNANLFKHYEFNFAGWNTKADGSGIAYANAAEITPAADMVLYAQWSNVGDVWNLFEDNSEHTYVLYGVYAESTIANSNARSSRYYDATLSGNKISVKLKDGVQRNTAAGAANSVLEFTQEDGSVITYTLPVSYTKPQLKLSANTYTIKDGVDSVAETTVLIRKAGGNYEPIAFGAGDVVTFVGKAAAVSADGKVSISANGKASGRLIVKKAGWDKEIALTFTVKAYKKDVISVDLGGAKSVTINTNAAGQKFSYPVYLNGKRATAADGITLSDASGVASYSDGTLTVAYKNGVKSGTRNVTLKKGNVSTVVKVKVSTMTLDKSVVLATQSRYDVVTGQSMVFVPKFTGIDGRITKVELCSVGKCAKNDFYAEINAAGNIVVSYDGNALNAKNLSIGDMSFKLTVTDTEGNDTVINKVVKNVKAKKSMPKITAVKMSASKDANGNTLGVVNIVSTYRDAKGATHTIAPVSAKIIGLTNVEAKVNANDPSQIDISNTKGIKGNGNVRVELTYPGGVTKKLTIQVKKLAK